MEPVDILMTCMNDNLFKIATWNVNSIRSRLDHATDFMQAENPDILLVQETKCTNDQFPHDRFAHMPYNISVHGQKSYNGVAIFSKYPIDDVKTDLPNSSCAEQARFLEITCYTPIGYSRIICVYVPNGGEVDSDKFVMKLKFLDALTAYLTSIKSPDENLIIGGDFNVAPFDIDVYDPKALVNTTCFTEIEKQKMRGLLNQGFEDLYRLLHKDEHGFTWWDYRAAGFPRNLGLRIDALLGNHNAASKLSECYVAKAYRALEKASDHAPLVAKFIRPA